MTGECENCLASMADDMLAENVEGELLCAGCTQRDLEDELCEYFF